MCQPGVFARWLCSSGFFCIPTESSWARVMRAPGDIMERLYAGFDRPIVRTSPRSAEMIKYASNALLACRISFSNEVAHLCELVDGVDKMASARNRNSSATYVAEPASVVPA